MITDFGDFILEAYGSNKKVEQLTDFIYKKVQTELGKLILNKHLVIKNYLQDNYNSTNPTFNNTVLTEVDVDFYEIIRPSINVPINIIFI